ncbi:hypothetical protein SELR_pSRC101990 (plasmid) [Selenomonas ruminantium subsp. lactilytica TAM6421]|uniref:Helix-turn-helix domain-containing protein n=1 Tax=Selenomonas ruminantium subsp. lactilytica (strain NBRC 103574 / TAM6421) TaxID=927704 RepID=I0GW69_SELRL|nr:helix-turn-helix domain-containing protein [Selenomonas ruminantium]BAL85006.1 hypothetical protein SELR_pSRC101990 [Selenomonas ruminantium subsp. lactilytica TAM6421]
MSIQQSVTEVKDFFTTKQAAELLGLTEYTIRKKIRNNEIKAIPGSNVREGYKIEKESLLEYAKKNNVSPFKELSPFQLAFALNPVVGAGVGIYSLIKSIGFIGNSDNNTIKDKERIYKLGIQRLDKEIEGLNLQIEALNLEDKSVENEKLILEKKIKINELEQKIKEIEIERAMDLTP